MQSHDFTLEEMKKKHSSAMFGDEVLLINEGVIPTLHIYKITVGTESVNQEEGKTPVGLKRWQLRNGGIEVSHVF